MNNKKYLLQKYLELYRTGQCSIDKAAEKIGITVNEMMQETARAGITSTQTIEEYKEGLALLQ